MFKLSNKSKKIMRTLSLGIVSLGLLAGIGMASNNSTNAHAMSAIEQKEYNNDIQSTAKDDAISDANEAKDRIKTDKVSPSDRISDEYEEENWGDNRFSKIAPAVFNGSYVKGSKADQRADANFINKYMKHEAQPATSKKAKKYVNRHDKNLARNKRAKKASRRTRKAKKHSYKKAKLVGKSAKVIKSSAHHNWRHVRPSKNHLSKLKKNHKKSIKKTSKSQKLTKKQVKHFNSLIRKDKKALRSKKAKKNYKYRKSLVKNIKLIKKFLIQKK